MIRFGDRFYVSPELAAKYTRQKAFLPEDVVEVEDQLMVKGSFWVRNLRNQAGIWRTEAQLGELKPVEKEPEEE